MKYVILVLKLILYKLSRNHKCINRINNQLEMESGVDKITSFPSTYIIGVNNVCNLKCPLCVTGIGGHQKAQKHMDIDLFRQVVDRIKDHATLVQIYKWGEPLLYKHIVEAVEYCAKYDLTTELSSNLSLKNIDNRLAALVIYKVKRLIVSFDGVTQEDYERYRVGGDLALVIDNIRKINKLKKEYRSQYPEIILQYLRNKYTTNQIDIIKNNYLEWGADSFYVADMTTIFKQRDNAVYRKWFDDDEIANRKYLDVDKSMLGHRCHFLYTTMIVEQDGSIPPCCFSTDPRDDFSSWDNGASIIDMYNSQKFIEARRLFTVREVSPSNACNSCSVYISFRERQSIT